MSRIFRSMVTISAVILLLFVPTAALFSQTGDAAPALTDSLFGESVPRAETDARLAAWDPETGVGLIAVRFIYPEGYHQIDDEEFFTLSPAPAENIIFGSTLKAEPIFKDGLAQYYDETTTVLEFRTAPNAQPTDLRIDALFQICNEEGTCLFPDQNTHVIAFDPASPSMEPDSVVSAVVEWAENPQIPEDLSGTNTNLTANPAAGRNILLFLLMAFVGGILLNIMPCVLPLLSVKALGLVKQAGQDRRAILKHSWLYVAGIEASFLILAGIVIVLQTSGQLLGWGFQFQSPAFVLVLIAVIWIFALSMFDVFVIEAPRGSLKGASAAGTRGGYLGSFLTGVFAVLVATPCTAPFLGAALGFAFSQSPIVILAIFSITGLGLGLPFLLLGIWPGFIKRLPKPGAWMNTFKEVMGFLLLGTTVYLFTTFAKLAPAALNGALWWMLFLAFSAWLLGKARKPSSSRRFRIIGQAAALAVVLISGLSLIDLQDSSESVLYSIETKETVPFVEEEILALIADDEPVFLEFTASWCTTCKVNQRVFRDDDVQDLMAEKGVTHVKGDLTSYDETMTRWLADFGRAGVPLYVLFRPGEEPHLFPELITVEGFMRELRMIQ